MSKNLNLFAVQKTPKEDELRPLADRMRPKTWEEFKGLESLDVRLIAQLKSGKGKPPSLILWGPPGSGKTTLARLIGQSFDAMFTEFSAVLVGVKEIRELAEASKKLPGLSILFVDEIHRLNKAQQDAFLPHVENGTFVLIGATTENPSFYLTSALLSRARVLVLPELGLQALTGIIEHASKELSLELEPDAIKVLVRVSGGDARRALNILEQFTQMSGLKGRATKDQLQKFCEQLGVKFYDRSGEEHYNMVSAFIKSMRGSDPDAALYWCFRMIDSGEDPRFLIRRMMIFASEDIGNADSRALTLAVSTAEAFDRLGLPEGRIPIAHCVTYLASAPKSNRSYVALNKATEAIAQHPKVSVPLHLRNAPTKLMESLGYGEDYAYPHNFEGGYVKGVQYLPDELKDVTFYEPSGEGEEKRILERVRERNK